MANAFYQKFKQSLLTEADTNKSLNQTGTNGTYVALVDTGVYSFSQSHQFYSSMVAGVVGTEMEITTPTVVNGTFDGDDVTFVAVTGASIEALGLVRKNSGANTTWRLVLFEDTSVTGLPVTPNGGNIIITWNASGIATVSDKRMKERIEQIGFIGSLPVYEYSYIGQQRRHVGVMAQEAEKVVRGSVIEFRARAGTRKAVYYDKVLEALAA